jgi:FIMAH domain
MASVRQSTFRSQLVVIAMALGLWLISGGLASATTAPSLQGLINQVADYAQSGQIYDAAAADDLTSMLTTVGSAIADGDSITARSLLDGFTNAVHQMSDVLMTVDAANHLTSLASTLSATL